MKLKDAQAELRKHGMVLKKTGYGNEHRVNFKGGKEETASYHDDVEDAVNTGKAMKEHQQKHWANDKGKPNT